MKGISLPIVSASRRTDIPAFYGDWFNQRIVEGYVDVPNPFNKKMTRVSLRPGEVAGYVFWSRNPAPFLPVLRRLVDRGERVLFHVTVTGLPREAEKRIPPVDHVVKGIMGLSGMLPKEAIIWRFDPMLSPEGGYRGEFRRRFLSIAQRLAPLVDRVMVSFLDPMRKTRRNFPEGSTWWPSEQTVSQKDEIRETLFWMQEETPVRGRIFLCSEPDYEAMIPAGFCIRATDLNRAWPEFSPLIESPSAPTRPGCGCDRAIDIGVYDTCPGGCRYCYAVSSPDQVLERSKNFDPMAQSLGVLRENH